MWKSGVVTSDSLYWQSGNKNWQPLCGLFEPPKIPTVSPHLEFQPQPTTIPPPNVIPPKVAESKRYNPLVVTVLVIGGSLAIMSVSEVLVKSTQPTEIVRESPNLIKPIESAETVRESPVVNQARAHQWKEVAAALSRTGATVESETDSNVMKVTLPASVSASITDYDAKRIAEMTYDKLGGAAVVIVTDGSGLRLARASMWGVSGRD